MHIEAFFKSFLMISKKKLSRDRRTKIYKKLCATFSNSKIVDRISFSMQMKISFELPTFLEILENAPTIRFNPLSVLFYLKNVHLCV